MNRKERKIIKRVLASIKMPRKWDNATANGAFHSEYFKEEITKPLENLCGWNTKDEATVKEMVTQLQHEHRDERFINVPSRLERIKESVNRLTEAGKRLFSRKKKDAYPAEPKAENIDKNTK